MTQYQSFPGTAGDSHSLQKLKALRLPPLRGRSFLDVGCNEGFFCGFAKFEGARRVVGLDKSPVFIERARQRFPDCEFVEGDWDHLPKGPFDVILLASALHYADDQPQLIHNLMKELSPDGTLVLEIGVHPKQGNEWVKVTRSIDERFFPTFGKVEEVLQSYAWKRVSPSVPQQGDPLSRFVFHVRARRPVAYLLMQPPGFGKSTIARQVFAQADVQVVSGDAIVTRVAQGSIDAPDQLKALIQREYAPLRIDQVTFAIARAGLIDPLVDLFVKEAGGRDFALDAFMPPEVQASVAELISDRGYMTVELTWHRVGEEPPSTEAITKRADAYFATLPPDSSGSNGSAHPVALPFKGTTGAVDHAFLEDGHLTVKGWALHETGDMPRLLRLRIGRHTIDVTKFEKLARPDIQKHYGLSHALFGYLMTAPVKRAQALKGGADIDVFGGNESTNLSGPFRKSGDLTAQVKF